VVNIPVGFRSKPQCQITLQDAILERWWLACARDLRKRVWAFLGLRLQIYVVVIMSMFDQFMNRIPSAGLSRAFGAVSSVEFPTPIQGHLNQLYAKLMGVNVEESERSPKVYKSLNAFFTRKLREDARPIDEHPAGMCCPVDGHLSEFGPLNDGTLVQAKGLNYSLVDLLSAAPETKRFRSASYATLYLSPRDYHRIHSPVAGLVRSMNYSPGHLFPVNRLGVRYIDDLFPRNERLTTFIETKAGNMVGVVKVGATCVGRISVAYDPFVTNRARARQPFRQTYEHTEIGCGDLLGMFNLGSTVVLVIEGENFEFSPGLAVGQEVRLGVALGDWR